MEVTELSRILLNTTPGYPEFSDFSALILREYSSLLYKTKSAALTEITFNGDPCRREPRRPYEFLRFVAA